MSKPLLLSIVYIDNLYKPKSTNLVASGDELAADLGVEHVVAVAARVSCTVGEVHVSMLKEGSLSWKLTDDENFLRLCRQGEDR